MIAHGDYILPVTMTEIQKKVSSAIVSSNFSEILSYFDGSEQSKLRYTEKLEHMLEDLNTVATHPFILLEHMQPNMASKRAANLIENASGKFQALVTFCKRFVNSEQNVAIICKAGLTSDLVESVLCDRGLHLQRYSASNSKLYKPDNQKAKGAKFHLIPSDIKDLTSAVYAAFDLMILVDDSFDVASTYGRGLRMQLRDPSLRQPFAPVLRLISCNTIQHLQVYGALSFPELIASAVVLRKQAGTLPSEFKRMYSKDLSELQPFVDDPERPCPIPLLPRIARANHKDVEKALYLDDDDQYQVNFSVRASSKKQGSESDSEVSEQQQVGEVIVKTEETEDSRPARKRRKIEPEPEVLSILEDLNATRPLSVALLVQYNDMLVANKRDHAELESHRAMAERREELIESHREGIRQLNAKIVDLESKLSDATNTMEKFRVRNSLVEKELSSTDEWWSKIKTEIGESLSKEDDQKFGSLASRIAELEDDNKRLSTDVANERNRYAYLQKTVQASTEYGETVNKEKLSLEKELKELKAKYLDAPLANESMQNEQIASKDSKISALQAEIDNLKESIKVQFNQDRNGRVGRPADRRGGRGRYNRHAATAEAST